MSKLVELIERPISGEWGEDSGNNNGIPVLRTTNFTDEGVLDYSNVIIRSVDIEKVMNKFLRKGDIIIEKSGGAPNKPVGRVVYFEADENKFLFNNFTSVLRAKDSIVKSKYLFYFLYFRYKMGYTWNYQNKTTGIANLQLERFINETKVKLPPLEEQMHIIRCLDKAKETIDEHKKQLIELDNLIKAIFYDMFGDPVINNKGWKVSRVKEYFNVKSGSTPSRECNEYWNNGTIPWIKTTEIKGNFIYNSKEYITELAAKDCRLISVPKGSLLIAMYGQGQTRGRTAKLMIDATINQACAALTKKINNINVDFVWNYLIISYEQLRALARGGNQPNLNKSLVENFEMPLPPIPLQDKFATIVANIEEQKNVVKELIKESQKLFNSLMNKYFV